MANAATDFERTVKKISSDFLFRTSKRFVLLDSKHKCFFCLKEVISNENGSNRFFLRNISRFLRLRGLESAISERGLVETCGRCSVLTDEFTDIYKALDMMQIRMNWCLRKICEVMETGSNHTLCNDGLKMSKKVANLRETTLLNGREQIRKTLYPTVSLKRMNLSRKDTEMAGNSTMPPPTIESNFLDLSREMNYVSTSEILVEMSQVEERDPKPDVFSSGGRGIPIENQPTLVTLEYAPPTMEQPEVVQDKTPTLACKSHGLDEDDIILIKEVIQEGDRAGEENYSKSDPGNCHLKPGYSKPVRLPEERPGPAKLGRNETPPSVTEEINKNFFNLDSGISLNGNHGIQRAYTSEIQQAESVDKPMEIQTLSPSFGIPFMEHNSFLSPTGITDKQRTVDTPPSIVSQSLQNTDSSVHQEDFSFENLFSFPSIGSNLDKTQISCSFCRAVFTTTRSKVTRSMNCHMVQYHCQHYFPSQKLDTLSDLQYQQILADLLFRDFSVEDMNHYKCQFCPSKFLAGNAGKRSMYLNRFKIHLVNIHREKMEAKLLRIQEDPKLLEKLQESKGISCECGIYIPSHGSYQFHRVNHCTLITPKDSKEDKGTRRHSNSQSKQPSSMQSIQIEAVSSKDEVVFEGFTNSSAASECPSLPLNDRQKIPFNSNDDDNQSEISSVSSSISKGYLSCPFCRATFPASQSQFPDSQHDENINLGVHILEYHCERYFPVQKLVTITDKQYRKILVDLLFRDFGNENTNLINCPWCLRSWPAVSSKCKFMQWGRFKLHLLNGHRKELEAKLLEIQRDPELSEKLRTCNTEGIHCECGVYLRSSEKEFHQLQHCTELIQNIDAEKQDALERGTATMLSPGNMMRTGQNFQDQGVHCQTTHDKATSFEDNMAWELEQHWTCDSCGYIYFFKDMLEAHQKNDCASAFSGVANRVSHSPNSKSKETADMNRRLNFKIEKDTFVMN